ncbi:MAG: acyltransferase [Solirubrobacterales bacterium]|nr:acyltransferase [Solirubrobacterales bacterium]
MSSVDSLVARIAIIRRGLRFRLWAARTRITLARLNCDFELVAPHGAQFATPPSVDPTRQALPGTDHARRGRLRVELGDGVHLGRQTTIEVVPSADNRLALGDGTFLGTGVRFVQFGGEIVIGPYGRVRDGVMMKSQGRLSVGSHAILQNGGMLQCAREVVLDDRVTLAERVSVIDSDHLVDGSDTYSMSQPLAIDPIHVGSNVWIGANVVLLRGCRLAANSVVAAGSVVRRGEYPAGWLIAGAPAEAKRALDGGERGDHAG